MDLKEIEKEMLKIQNELIPLCYEKIQKAREAGDLSENHDYSEARENLYALEVRKRELENILNEIKCGLSEKRKSDFRKLNNLIVECQYNNNLIDNVIKETKDFFDKYNEYNVYTLEETKIYLLLLDLKRNIFSKLNKNLTNKNLANPKNYEKYKEIEEEEKNFEIKFTDVLSFILGKTSEEKNPDFSNLMNNWMFFYRTVSDDEEASLLDEHIYDIYKFKNSEYLDPFVNLMISTVSYFLSSQKSKKSTYLSHNELDLLSAIFELFLVDYEGYGNACYICLDSFVETIMTNGELNGDVIEIGASKYRLSNHKLHFCNATMLKNNLIELQLSVLKQSTTDYFYDLDEIKRNGDKASRDFKRRKEEHEEEE